MTRPTFCKLEPCRYAACDCERPSEKNDTAELRSALDRRDESLVTRILNLRAKVDRLERELAAVGERLDWTVADNANKAIEIADLKAAQSATQRRLIHDIHAVHQFLGPDSGLTRRDVAAVLDAAEKVQP